MQNEYTKEVKCKSKLVGSIYETFESVIFAIALVLIIFTFFAKLSVVEGDSMYPTLNDKDYLVVSNVFFSYEPENGDIVVVQTKKHPDGAIVKRVIATENQTVRIKYNYPFDGSFDVYVDDVLVEEDYAYYGSRLAIIPSQYEYELEIPENCVYVLGDNRNISLDSRTFGVVEENEILGKVVFRLLPSPKKIDFK